MVIPNLYKLSTNHCERHNVVKWMSFHYHQGITWHTYSYHSLKLKSVKHMMSPSEGSDIPLEITVHIPLS